MFVSEWMTRKVFTVSPEQSISDAAEIAKERGIKHLPVVKGDKLKGILSDRDIKEYVPSKATSLDVYELHYLLAKTKVKEIMKKALDTAFLRRIRFIVQFPFPDRYWSPLRSVSQVPWPPESGWAFR